MGNFSSCVYVESNTAKLIDLRRNILRLVEIPLTAAELMLEEPGHVIAPVSIIRRDFRFSAVKADESLVRGEVYVLIPVIRVNGKVSESEMVTVKKLVCGERTTKRRSSRVLPVANEISTVDNSTNPIKLLDDLCESSGVLSCRTRHWKPTLAPIYENYIY